jgi:hypothetical protein
MVANYQRGSAFHSVKLEKKRQPFSGGHGPGTEFDVISLHHQSVKDLVRGIEGYGDSSGTGD